MKVLILVLVLGLALSDASPILRQLRRLIHAKRQEAACVSASNNLGQILDRIERWGLFQNDELSFSQFLEVVSPIDILDGSQRQDLLCSMDGLATVSEAASLLDDIGVIQHEVRVLYAAAVANMRLSKLTTDRLLQDGPPVWLTEETHQHMILANQFITDLEASMFGSYEPELVNLMMKIFSRDGTSMDDYVVPLPSPQPLDQQCAVIAIDVHELWDFSVQQREQRDPHYGEHLRETIHEWTGLSFGNHGPIREFICNVLEIGVNGGPGGLYEFLMLEGIVDRVANTGYPYLQERFEMLRQRLEYMLGNHTPANQYAYGGGKNHELAEMLIIGKDLLDNLEAMGLLSLS